MVDELGIFERHLMKRMLAISKNLSDPRNRSFVVFGSVPLSFGSLTSVNIDPHIMNNFGTLVNLTNSSLIFSPTERFSSG